MEHYVNLPLTEEKALQLRCGDTVYLTGEVYTSRDAGHKRMVELLSRGEDLPFDPTNATIYYVGPSPARPGQVIGSAGPTTSGRMDAYAPRLLSVGARGMFSTQSFRRASDWRSSQAISSAFLMHLASSAPAPPMAPK